jgi:hypothetical protein
VDNFAAGFLRAGARAVLADAHSSLGYELRAVLRGRGNLVRAWRRDADYNHHERRFGSRRTPGFTVYMDPDSRSNGFYRSLVTTPRFSPRHIRRPSTHPKQYLFALPETKVMLRATPSVKASSKGTVAAGAKLRVIGRLVHDRAGRAWVPVRTGAGRNGYVAGWLARIGGPGKATMRVKMHAHASSRSRSYGTLSRGARFRVVGTWSDAKHHVWLKIRLRSGRVGWVASYTVRA